MKKLKNVSKRLLALALALALVVGYIPARASAEGENSSLAVEAEILCLANADINNGEEDAPSPEPAVKTYTYSVVVKANGEDVTGAFTVVWDGDIESDVPTTATTASATVSYNGIVLHVTSDKPASWTASASWGGVAYVGTVPSGAQVTGSALAGSFGWETTYSVNDTPVDMITVDMLGQPITATHTLGVFTLTSTSQPVAYAPVSVAVDAVDGTWYNDEIPNVTVTATSSATSSATIDPTVANNVTVEGGIVSENWTNAGDGTYTATVTPNDGATSMTVNGVELKVDAVSPEITVDDAYVKNGKTYVDITYTVGNSGIASITVNDKTVTAPSAPAKNETATLEVGEVLTGPATVVMKNGAIGAGAVTASSQEDIHPDIEIEIAPPSVTVGSGPIYVNAGAEFTVTVKNAQATYSAKVADKVQVFTDNVYKYILESGSVSDLKAEVTEDYHERKDDFTLSGTYVVDNEGPIVTTAYAYYVDDDTTIVKFAAKDTQSGLASVTFNGGDPITLDNTNVNSYEVTGESVDYVVTDKLGNETPGSLTITPALTVKIDERELQGEENTQYVDASNDVSYLYADESVYHVYITITGTNVNNNCAVDQADLKATYPGIEWNFDNAATGDGTITGTLTLPPYEEGKVTTALEPLTIDVSDSENRTASASTTTTYKYDDAAPEITIDVPSITDDNPGYDADPTVYFYNEQTVTIQIYDDTPLTGYAVSGTLNGDSDWEVLTSDTGWTDTTTEDGKNGKQYVITLGNNQSVGSITVSAMDSCENNSNENAIEGKSIEVDTHAPEVTASVNGTVTNFCLHGDNWYAEVEAVESKGGITGFIESITKRDNVDVVITVKVVDNNLATALDSEDGWTESDKDPDGNITYTKDFSVKVNANEKKSLMIFIPKIADGAGRTFTEEEIDVTMDSANGSEAKTTYKLAKDEDNNYSGTLNIDRRSPENGDNTATTPVVRLSYSKNYTTKSDKTKLFSGPITCDLDIKDTGAGLKSIKWELSDSKNFKLSKTEVTYDSDNYKTSDKQSVTITPNEKVEANTKLTITITDNMGNSYIYTEDFAEDNYGPRINVDVSGKSVRANEYFNKDRIATITVTDANLPDIKSADFASKYINVTTNATSSSWTQSGNTYVGTYTYSTDGKYQLTASGADIAGNKATVTYNGEHPTKFVVDKTAPIISVTYNPAYPSGKDRTINHYDEILTAYFSIKETNFDANDVVDKFVNSGHNLVPASWNNNGDSHTASATFNEGNNYSFSIDFTDLAGNVAVGYKSFAFCVDLHAPTIKITKGDLTTKELNIIQDDLTLGVTINDEQKNLSKYSVTVTHLDNNFKKTTVTGKDYYTVTTLEDRTTVTVDFAKIASTKENDGLYTVEITAEDYAGHKVTLGDGLDFSLNRFGSTFYSEDDYTLEFLTTGSDGNAYHRSVDNKLIVKELNPNKVYTDSTKKSEGSVLTVLVNGTSTKLVEGEDYKMSVSEEGTGTNKWYVYTYEIDPEAFEDSGTVVDGRYSVLIYGEDAAGNKNTNESNDSGKLQKDAAGEYNGKIEFTLDATAPIITTTGIESGKTYNAAAQKLEIFLSDNTPTGIAVYVNGELIKLSEADDLLADTATYLVWDEANGCYVLNVPEQDGIFDSQNVKTVATDAAGNMSEEAIEDFIVSTSFIVRWLNSVWFYVILALLLAAAAALGIVIFRKKKA